MDQTLAVRVILFAFHDLSSLEFRWGELSSPPQQLTPSCVQQRSTWTHSSLAERMVKKSRAVEVEERFNAVVEEFGALLRRAIVRLCPHDKGLQFDDIEQEARMRLWRALQDEREVTNYASYLYRIAATATIDAMRRIQARHEEQLDILTEQKADDGEIAAPPVPALATATVKDSPERVAESREVIGKVMSTLGKFPDEQRRAVGMYLQGMTSQEVADLMGWTEPKSRNLIYRGLKELRKSLREEGIDYQIE